MMNDVFFLIKFRRASDYLIYTFTISLFIPTFDLLILLDHQLCFFKKILTLSKRILTICKNVLMTSSTNPNPNLNPNLKSNFLKYKSKYKSNRRMRTTVKLNRTTATYKKLKNRMMEITDMETTDMTKSLTNIARDITGQEMRIIKLGSGV